ncbi:MAG: hypothetical protein AAF385_00730 [Pseudomonadota bacterium]
MLFALLPGTLAFSLTLMLAPFIALLMLPGLYGLLRAAAKPNSVSTITALLLLSGIAVHLWLGSLLIDTSSESSSLYSLSWRSLLFFTPSLVALWQLCFWRGLPRVQLPIISRPNAGQRK